MDMGPIRFARGTHKHRFPITMRPLTQSEFYLDPFIGIDNAQDLARQAEANALVLDIDTSNYFSGLDPASMTLEQAREHVGSLLEAEQGAVTLGFDETEHDIVSIPMTAGSFVMFYERTMHGSSANLSERRRLGINARFTTSDTTVYPYRTNETPIDGSNLNIRDHACVIIARRKLKFSKQSYWPC